MGTYADTAFKRAVPQRKLLSPKLSPGIDMSFTPVSGVDLRIDLANHSPSPHSHFQPSYAERPSLFVLISTSLRNAPEFPHTADNKSLEIQLILQ
jgi:hypothetical protein